MTVSVPEMFQYWLQGGRISIGFLGGAQIDRFGNVNSSVIGSYEHPKVRLPGGGGAPEIASLSGQTYVVMRQTTRTFVEQVDFITSFGYGMGGDHRQRLGIRTIGTDARYYRSLFTTARPTNEGICCCVDPRGCHAERNRTEHSMADPFCTHFRTNYASQRD